MAVDEGEGAMTPEEMEAHIITLQNVFARQSKLLGDLFAKVCKLESDMNGIRPKSAVADP